MHLYLLSGLTEMFPESLRNATVSLVETSWSLTKSSYSFGRSAAWVLFTSATLLFMPVRMVINRSKMRWVLHPVHVVPNLEQIITTALIRIRRK
jgi:hypothetical protein